MRFLADEDLPAPTVIRLRELGHDVVTALEIGMANDETPDEDMLALAAGSQRVLLTHNRRHFHRLHEEHPDHFGMVLGTRDADFQLLAERIDTAVSGTADIRGKIIRVIRPNPG